MRYTEEHYELLLKSLDQRLNADEQKQLDQALAASEDLRLEKENLMALRLALSKQKVSATPSDFTQGIARCRRCPLCANPGESICGDYQSP